LSDWLICGSGPTLANADFDTLPAERIAVNAAMKIVPNCDLVACVDDLTFRPDLDALIGDRLRIVIPHTLEVARNRGTNVGRHVIVERRGGSTGAAVTYAISKGATRIIFYGIGGVGYCDALNDHWREQSEGSIKIGYIDSRKEWTEYAESQGVKLDIR
jgi:hypothetical protein